MSIVAKEHTLMVKSAEEFPQEVGSAVATPLDDIVAVTDDDKSEFVGVRLGAGKESHGYMARVVAVAGADEVGTKFEEGGLKSHG